MATGSSGEQGGLPIAVGARLKDIRQGKWLTLREVAKRLAISPSLLSQVENGKTQPSVGTLYGLVTFYGVSMDAVLTGREPSGAGPEPSGTGRPRPAESRRPQAHAPGGAAVQRAQENPKLVMENGVTWERLAIVTSDRSIQPILVTYAPGASSSLQGKWTQHLGVEYAYLLSGVLTLHLEFDVHEVGPGDSIAFDSTRPHYYSNETDQDAKAVFFVDNRERDEVGQAADGADDANGVARILTDLGLAADPPAESARG
ncbi:XRE family transcriptional regulator [Kribbella sancticallisti]|uniref:XRE family transcriptional regulator n=1 Tax=Kribbella sancticallisti TaxID=460087 RepID=A0ABP4MY48_9ACTN